MQNDNGVREKILIGGSYQVIRRGISVILGLVGMLLLTRIIGPGPYGLFSAANGIFTYLAMIGVMGVKVYLIRQRGDAREIFDQAFWWLLFAGTGLAVISSLVIITGGSYWIRTEGFTGVAVALCIMLPLSLVSHVPIALLERELYYRQTTIVEISSLILYYVFAIPLAWMGFSVWALVFGFWGSQLTYTISSFVMSRYRPKWFWSRDLLKTMINYSFMQALSDWIYNLRHLAPSVLLLPFAGQEAVGYWTITERYLNMVSFAKEIAKRLSIPVFALIQNDYTKLRNAISEAITLQSLIVGASIAAFAAVAPWILPHLLGHLWSVQIIMLVYVIAGSRMLVSTWFAIQGSALYVIKQNSWMLRASIMGTVTFALLGYIAVVYLPQEYRLWGFLIADFIGHIPNYWYRHQGIKKFIGRPAYATAFLWTASMLCALFAPVISWWLYAPAVILLLNSYSLRELRRLFQNLRRRPASGRGEATTKSPPNA